MDSSQNNPFGQYFEQNQRNYEQRQEAIRQQKEELDNERKLQAQRLLANKTGGELAKILSVINPNLSVLGTVLGSTTEYAKQAYKALDEMSTKLSEVNASAKLLGVNIEGLKGASEMHKDILKAQTTWRAFIEEVEIGIGKLYGMVQQEDRVAGMSNKELLKENVMTGIGAMFSGVMTTVNPLSALGTVKGIVKQEQIIEELDKRKDKEKAINERLQEYADAIGGVAGADTSLVKQLVNIEDNLTATQNELIGYASTGVTSLAGAGVNNDVDQNRWTSLMLGYTEKIFRDMEGSVGFDQIYEDVLNYFISGKADGLNKYGYGLTDEALYGYAQTHKDMYLGGGTKYRDDKMIETRFDFFKMWTSSTDELKESMYDLGYEIKNNTNALQKWQWLESIGGISTEKGSSSYSDYFAVDSDGNEITNQLYGTFAQRLGASMQGTLNYLGHGLDYVISGHNYQKAIAESGLQFASSKYGSAIGYGLGAVDVSGERYTPEQLGFNTNTVNASGKTLDEVININVTASENLKVEVEKMVQDHTYNTMNSMQINPNTQSGKYSF